MKEKILALLSAKFAGVRKDGLAQLAVSLSLQADNEDEATALVEKMTSDKVDNFVKDWRKDVDKEVSEANKTYEKNLKTKFDFVEKKEPNPGNPNPGNPSPEDTPAWAKALIDQNQKLADKISQIEGQKVSESRLQMLTGKFDGVPESYKKQQLEYNSLLVGNMSDEQFVAHLAKVEQDITGFKQELADKGLSGQTRPIMGGANDKGVSQAVASFIDSQKADAPKNLEGKKL